jgi:glucuronoarabinoxylan endo-1,4-beta-xylanase
MNKYSLAHIFLLSLCAWMVVWNNHASAQTVVVQGTISTTATTVRNASVSFSEKANPSNVFSTLTDSTGRYRLTFALTSASQVAPRPSTFELAQNYPNPFSSSTAISYRLATQGDIKITIYDILGRVVRETLPGVQSVGRYSILWDGRNAHGQKVSPGVYFYSLQAGSDSRVRKMVLNGSGNGMLPFVQSTSPPMGPSTRDLLQDGPGGVYVLRVENAVNTFPLIAARQIDSVTIMGDSTLNLSVENQYPVPVSTVSPDSLQQYIRGFGGANILPWRPAMTAGQMQTAFGAGEGELGFTILRLRIPFTDDPGEFNAQLQVAQMAQSLGAIVFASPWTPPPAMKRNNDIVGGVLNDTSYAAYATHLKTFADYLAGNSAPLYAVSLQNEPDATVTYESCSWNAVQFRTFMRNNAPAIGARVMMPEGQNFVHALSDSTLNDSTAAAHTSIIAGHIYGGGLGPYPLAVSKGKEVWMTEHLDLDTSWAAVLATGREIHDVMSAGMNAYVTWYLVRFYGPISEDGTVSKRGYVMSQFARFVRPGYYKVKCNPIPQRNVWVSSYRDISTSRVVIVALNAGTTPVQQAFTVTNGSMTTFASYTTSRWKNCLRGSDLPVTNGSFTATLEPSSITTFVSQ